MILSLGGSGAGGNAGSAGSQSTGTQFFYNSGATVGISSSVFILALIIFAWFMLKK